MKKKGVNFFLIFGVIGLLVLVGIALSILLGNSSDSPTQAYMEYKRAFDKIDSFEDYAKLGEEYGSDKFKAETAEYRDSLQVLPLDLRKTILELQKGLSPTYNELKRENFEETMQGENDALLKINSVDSGKAGEIKMVKVQNYWKIDEEKWIKN
jgi:hypothetical protein